MRIPRIFAAFALLSLAGCAHGKDTSGEVTVSYAADAQQNYDLGLKELDGKNYPEANKYFEYVENKFPYTHYAALAQLSVADTQFAQEKYVEAIDGYRNFIKLHPTHAKVDYAAFHIGLSYEEQIPSDFFVLPNSAEKDQTDVKSALNAFEDFLQSYPHSPLVKDAQAKVADLRRRLADHEMRVAQFYLDHDRLKAAVGRYAGVIRDYPGLGFDAKALIRMGRLYLELGEKDQAKAALEKLLREHPDDSRSAEAKKLLRQIG